MLALQKNEVFADRFLLKELIGTRGVSEVWVSDDLLENDDEVAVKIYAPLDRTEQHFLEKLKQDIATDQTLQHNHLLQTYDFDVYNGYPYVVMPYIAQGSLKSKVHESGGALTEFDVAVLLKQIGGALHLLHTSEPLQLHQNVKPDNILVAAEDDYILTDSRIHNRIRAVLPRIAGHAENIPTAYAPPELFTARPSANSASDIFSFGVTLYELCAGQLPWMGNGGLSLLQGAAVPMLPGMYPRELNKMVTACMDPKWENRPTAKELVEEGNYFIDNGKWKPYGRFSVAKVDVVKYEKRSPLKIALWAAAILMALSALGYFLYTQTDMLQNVLKPIAGTPDSVATTTLATAETTANEGTGDPAINEPETELEDTATPVTQAVAPPPVAPKEEPAVRETPSSKPAVRKPAYPRPTSADQYVAQIQNKSIPIQVREQWRGDVWRFFDRQASVNYVVGDELVGILSADELVDIMLDQENPTAIRIDSTKKNAAGKIEQIFVHVQE